VWSDQVYKEKETKKKAFYWNESHEKAFNNIKATVTRDEVLAYPDYNQVFEIFPDASSKHLGSMITQNNRPIAFFISKLSETQKKYSVTELELLAILETLKEFAFGGRELKCGLTTKS